MARSADSAETTVVGATADRLRAVLPVLLLVLVAGHQIRLARMTQLTPWKGGGFGMFSTTDGLSHRRLRIVVRGPGRAEELLVPNGLRKLAARAAALPDATRLDRPARAIAEDQSAAGGPVESIEIDVLGTSYARKTLFATERILASHHHRPGAAVAADEATDVDGDVSGDDG